MDAIETLVRQHGNELFGYLCRMVGNPEQARDVLGETLLRAVEHDRGKGGEPIGRAWLYRVATNAAISCWRRQRVRRLFRTMVGDAGDETSPSPQELAQQGEEARRVREAVARLDRRHRPVLVMSVYQEMSHEEIAVALGLNVGTVKSRLFEAKRRVAKMLEETHG